MLIKIVVGAVVGAVGGFLFYRFVGCKSGACRIASNPYLSVVYWALIGALAANLLFRK
jgi:hypothetical protein